MIPPKKILQYALEIGLILFALAIYTQNLQDFAPDKRIHGDEFSYLIGSGAVAHSVFQKTGAIPLWNPFIGMGEPLIENPFSYVLNPLMTWPVLLYGAYNGAKIAVLIHAAIMGVGGWLLAYSLRFRLPARLFLALVLAGSGSMVATIGDGFYQMALSQAYIPWVLAGVVGTLYLEKRWPIVVLAAATTLMIFAGTFWHVLPTAIGAGLLTVFALVGWDSARRRPLIHWRRLRRATVAGGFILGLAAIRLIPQFVNQDLVIHPNEMLRNTFSFGAVLFRHFQITPPTPDMNQTIMHYHYILPLSFAVGLVIVRGLLLIVDRRRPSLNDRPPTYLLLIPSLLMIVILTIWATENTPLVKFLYDHIRFLNQWRYVGRMGATASVFIALVAALWLDDLTLWIGGLTLAVRGARWSGTLVRAVLLLVLIGTGSLASLDVLNNWRIHSGLDTDATHERIVLTWFREQHPTEFMPILTWNFYRFLPHYEFLLRASFGNPDYRPLGLPSTLGTWQTMTRVLPQYALLFGDPVLNVLKTIGYKPVPGAPQPFKTPALYFTEQWPGYLFTTTLDRLNGPQREKPIYAFDTLPVTQYTHNIDAIKIHVNNYPLNSVLIVQETAYPGWTATINGTPVIVESVGERIGVQLPNDVEVAEVEFRYRPILLYQSAMVSGIAFIGFTVYALQLDRRLRPPRMIRRKK